MMEVSNNYNDNVDSIIGVDIVFALKFDYVSIVLMFFFR